MIGCAIRARADEPWFVSLVKGSDISDWSDTKVRHTEPLEDL
jgi:hypothetical protein